MNIRVHPNVAVVHHFDDFSTTSPHFTPLILHSYAFSCKEKNFFVKKRKKVLGYRTEENIGVGIFTAPDSPQFMQTKLAALGSVMGRRGKWPNSPFHCDVTHAPLNCRTTKIELRTTSLLAEHSLLWRISRVPGVVPSHNLDTGFCICDSTNRPLCLRLSRPTSDFQIKKAAQG